MGSTEQIGGECQVAPFWGGRHSRQTQPRQTPLSAFGHPAKTISRLRLSGSQSCTIAHLQNSFSAIPNLITTFHITVCETIRIADHPLTMTTRPSNLPKVSAMEPSKEKNQELIAIAKTYKNTPWCEQYERMISGML